MLGAKTLLVNPPLVGGSAFTRQGRCQEREEVLGTTKPPYTLAVMAALLRDRGHDVRLVDLTATARSVDDLKPVDATSGNQANNAKLRVAAGALETVGDVFSRFLITYGIGAGLRDGLFTYVRDDVGYAFDLDHVKWTNDLEVTGTMEWNLASGNVTAEVKPRQNGKNVGDLSIAWNDVQSNAIATLTGTIGGDRVKAKRIAP